MGISQYWASCSGQFLLPTLSVSRVGRSLALVQIDRLAENFLYVWIPYRLNRTSFQTAGAVVSLSPGEERLNCPLRMRCISLMPEIVVAALLNRLKPSITFVRDLMLRWSCSTRLFRYFEDRIFVPSGSRPSDFISRTARCEAAYPSSVIVYGGCP